jgi:hypothetical protein
METPRAAVIDAKILSGTIAAISYFRPFLEAFFGFAFFDGADFCAALLPPPRLPLKAVSHPSAYR